MLIGLRHEDGKIGIIDVNLLPEENHQDAINAVKDAFPKAKPVPALIQGSSHAKA